MRQGARSHPWLTAGIVSFGILVAAVTFIGFATAPSNVEPPQPNSLGPYLGIAVLALVITFPVFTASLVGGAVSVWHRRGRASKFFALVLLLLAVPFLLYSLFLLLAFVGVINAY